MGRKPKTETTDTPKKEKPEGQVSKITAKTIGVDAEKIVAAFDGQEMGARLPLYSVWGVAKELIAARDNNDFLAITLKGTFQAVNQQSGSEAFGKEFEGARAVLPPGVQELVEEPVGGPNGDAKNPTEFAVSIHATKAPGRVGYTLGATFISNPAKADPLARLREAVKASTLQPAIAGDGQEAERENPEA